MSSAGEQLDEGPDGARARPRGSFWMCGPCRTGVRNMGPIEWTEEGERRENLGGKISV